MKKFTKPIFIMIVVIVATALISCERDEITVRQEVIAGEDKMHLECTLNSDSIYTDSYLVMIIESKKFITFRPDTFPQLMLWYDTLATIDANSVLGENMNIAIGYQNSGGSYTTVPLDPDKTYGDIILDVEGDSVLNANFDIVTECYNPFGEDTVFTLVGSINDLYLQ